LKGFKKSLVSDDLSTCSVSCSLFKYIKVVGTQVEPRLKQLKSIFEMEKKDVERLLSPYFYVYHKNLFEKDWGLDGFLKWCQQIAKTSQVEGKKVLDLGCGFGVLSVYLALAGAEEVVGIDINKDKIDVFQKILSMLRPPVTNVRAKVSDGSKTDYWDEYFDLVLVVSVISHVRELNLFISETRKVLKKNGLLYIHEENNALNLMQTIKRRKLWKIAENGPINDAALGLELPYCEMRKHIIRARFPTIDSEKLDKLAKITIGMWGEEIYNAVEAFIKGERIETCPAFKYRNPKTGEFPERDFNPFQLRKTIEQIGFKAKVSIGPIQRAGIPTAINDILSLLSPISIPLAFKFDVSAHRKD
jgi:2-polyprenyl-3-methyl-5-hydroxy-6-metoxy-1,4-benzoquinol methylase